MNAIGIARTVASVTGRNPDDTVYATSHTGDGTRWTEIRWYFYENNGSPAYEIYACNSCNGGGSISMIGATAPGATLYTVELYSGYSSPPWYLWDDELWNGTSYQVVAQGWLSCPDACGPSDPNVATEAWTNENYDGVFLTLNNPVDDDSVQVSLNGAWNLWTPSIIPNTTSVTTAYPYCGYFDNEYYNFSTKMC